MNLSDTNVLDRLSKIYSPGEFPMALEQLLRVPLAWQYLRRPAILATSEVIATHNLQPGTLAMRSIDLFDKSADEATLKAVSGKSDHIWQQTMTGGTPPHDLETAAYLALGIIQRTLKSDGKHLILGLLHNAPAIWRTPFIIAWPKLKHRNSYILELMKTDSPILLSLACDCLAVNMKMEDAAQVLLEIMPSDSGQILLQLNGINEKTLAQHLVDQVKDTETGLLSDRDSNLEQVISKAMHHLVKGNLSEAKSSLDHSMNMVSKAGAFVADHLAETAFLEKDLQAELEARRQALQSDPTPARRALLALALAQFGKLDEAIAVLPEDPEHVEERISAAFIHVRNSQISKARELVLSLLDFVPELLQLDFKWLSLVTDVCVETRQLRPAIKFAEKIIESAPTDSSSRARVARIFSLAGDPSAAIDQSRLALALDPGSIEAKKVLAACLQETGKPDEALPIHQAIASETGQVDVAFVRCALQAEQYEVAAQIAAEFLAEHPNSQEISACLRQAQAQLGDVESTLVSLEQQTQQDPENVHAWIALASILYQQKRTLDSGLTLSRGIQALPNSAKLHNARSVWLETETRFSEALDEARQTHELAAEDVSYLLHYAKLLEHLAQPQSDEILSRIAELQPCNWEIQTKLAGKAEADGDILSAFNKVDTLPEILPVEANFLAGRIGIKAASEGLTTIDLPLRRMRIVVNTPESPVEACFWLGRAYSLLKLHTETINTFQSYLSNQGHTQQSAEFRVQAFLGLAQAALKNDDLVLALTTLEDAFKEYPLIVKLQLALTDAYLASGLYDQALEIIEKTATETQGNSELLALFFKAALQSGSLEKVKKAVLLLEQQFPEQAASWMMQAQYHLQANHQPEMRRALAQSLWLDRKNPDLLDQAALLLLAAGMRSDAQQILKFGSYCHPDNQELMRHYAETSEESQDFENAQKAWRQFTNLNPENIEGYLRAATALLALNRVAAAREMLERALQKDDKNLAILLRLADLNMDEHQLDQADKLYSKAIDMAPEDANTLYHVALGWLRSGKINAAEDLLKRAIRQEPSNPVYQLKLAEALIDQGRITPAFDLLTATCNQSGLSSKAYSMAAYCAARENDHEFATKSFARAHASVENNHDETVWLARAARELGHWAVALNALASIPDKHDLELIKMQILLDALDADYVIRTLSNAPAYAISDRTLAAFSDEWMATTLLHIQEQAIPEARDIELRLACVKATSVDELDEIRPNIIAPSLSSSVLSSLVIADLRFGDNETALSNLTVLKDNHQQTSWLTLVEGIAHLNGHDAGTARTSLETASENPQLKPLALYHLANSCVNDNDLDSATRYLSEGLSIWKKEPRWQHQLGKLYLEQSNLSAALPHLQMAVELDNENITFLTSLARTFTLDGQFMEAATLYDRLLQLEPGDSLIWVEAGNLVLEMGDAVRAQQWFERARALGHNHVACLHGSARAAFMLGDNMKALQRAQEALQLSADDPALLFTLGDIYHKLNNLDQALEMYDLALETGERTLALTTARIRVLISMKRSDEVTTELKDIIRSEPDNDSLWMLLAESQEKAGKYSAALEAASRAVRLAPRNSNYRLIIARMCRKLGQLDRAVDELIHAQELAPGNASVQLELAHVFEDRKDVPHALEIYQKILDIDPENALAPYRAGLILKNMKAYQEAGNMFKLAVNLNPKDPDAMHQLAAVRALELVHGETLKTVVSL